MNLAQWATINKILAFKIGRRYATAKNDQDLIFAETAVEYLVDRFGLLIQSMSDKSATRAIFKPEEKVGIFFNVKNNVLISTLFFMTDEIKDLIEARYIHELAETKHFLDSFVHDFIEEIEKVKELDMDEEELLEYLQTHGIFVDLSDFKYRNQTMLSDEPEPSKIVDLENNDDLQDFEEKREDAKVILPFDDVVSDLDIDDSRALLDGGFDEILQVLKYYENSSEAISDDFDNCNFYSDYDDDSEDYDQGFDLGFN